MFEGEKGSSYSRDMDSSLNITKMRVGKRNQTTKSVLFSGSSPYETAMLYEGTKYQREGEPENQAREESQVSAKWEQGAAARRRRELAEQLPSGHRRVQAKENSPSELFHSGVGFPALIGKTWKKNCYSFSSALPDHVPSGILNHKGSTCCSEPLHCTWEAATRSSSGSQ